MSTLVDSERTFAGWLRQREAPTDTGIEPRRLQIYRDLVFRNIEGFLSSGFPVCRKLFDETEWHALVRAFLLEHRCESPYFREICAEFLTFLESRDDQDRPWLLSLAHYEWVELALDIAPDMPSPAGLLPDADLLETAPVLSPHVKLLAYDWPVHLIGPGAVPTASLAEPVHLLVYRNRTHQVEFMTLNAATARLLALVADNTDTGLRSGADLLAQLAVEMHHPDPRALAQFGAEMLADFRRRDVIHGGLSTVT